MNHHSLAHRFLAGAAGLAIAAISTVALSAPAHAQEPAETEVTPSSVEFEDSCDGTLVTLHSGTELDHYEWVVVIDDEFQDGALVEELAPGESKTVLAPWQWEAIEVFFRDAPADFVPQKWTWEAPEGCPDRDPLPPELGTWTFDCQTVEITFVNVLEMGEAFYFTPSVGDAQRVEIAHGESATVELPSAEGLVIEIRFEEQGDLGRLITELEITSEMWEDRGCLETEADEDGAAGELPVTGASTGLLALGAVALLTIGGGLFFVARRRKATFTA